jgi:hypothetical protein
MPNMSDQDELRNRAARLLAMALKAREEGHLDSAERFTQRASEILDQPSALERLGTQRGEKVIEPPEPKVGRHHSRRRARRQRASAGA